MWLAVSALPADGAELEFTDPSIWTEPIREFGLDCRVTRPLRATVSVLPQAGDGVDGCIVRGHLSGEVVLPCDRCAEDAIVPIDEDFDSFEPFPSGSGPAEADASVVRLVDGRAEINVAGLLWEEFSMALPVKPLCRPGCRGLCPVCGANRNDGTCGCTDDAGDSRLAVLRGLQVGNKQRGTPHNE